MRRYKSIRETVHDIKHEAPTQALKRRADEVPEGNFNITPKALNRA